jgi:cytochrome P450
LNHGFTPQAVASLEPKIQTFVCELLDRLVPGKVFDFVTDVAAKIPVSVTCGLLGIPGEDWAWIANLSTSSFAAEDREFWNRSSVEETLALSNIELLSYFLDLIAVRRQQPEQDLVSTMIALCIDGNKLSSEEIALNCFSFLLGGNETIRYAAASGLFALIRRPEVIVRLRENHALISSAVEEILRWATPNAHVLRVATKDVRIRDQMIRTGEMVTLWSTSANRDEAVFPNPYEFDIGREPNQHLTFGIGNHYCIGASIARLELKVLFLEIVRRGYCFEVEHEPSHLRSIFL